MRKILKIAHREYIETVKTKTFILSLLLIPAIIVGMIFISNRIAKGEKSARPAVKITVSDFSKQLSNAVGEKLNAHNNLNPTRQILYRSLYVEGEPAPIEEQGKAELRAGKTDAYIVIDKDILDSSGKVHFYTYKTKPTILESFWTVERIINSAVVEQRCELQNVSLELLSEIRNVPIERVEIGADDSEQRLQNKSDKMIQMMVPFFFMFMIYMGIVGIGQQMLTSLIEEKNSRIIEVLLSAVSPFELMAGKILGLAGIGLTVVALLVTAGLSSACWHGLDIDISAGVLSYFVIYYILGFLLFSSMLAAIGSVCNTLKESQGIMMPIVWIFIVPLMCWYQLVQSPDGTLSRVLSFIPPVTPLVMILRISAGSDVGPLEIAASIALLIVSVFAMVWLAGKIFRTGILMYGKRPSLREIFQWLR